MSFDTPDILLNLVKIGIVLSLVLSVTPVWVWVERRGSGLIQDRPGPNRIGPLGLIQAMADAADVVLPTTIFAEKSGTFTNVQGRLQKIVAGSLPKGEALPEWEILRRLGVALAPEETSYAFSEVEELFDQMVAKTPALRSLDWSGIEQFGVTGAPQGS